MRSIIEFGGDPKGNGDVGLAFAKAFAANEREIFLPDGDYALITPIEIPSDTTIQLSEKATVFAAPGKFRSYHMVGNAGRAEGTKNITVTGGTWDGRCAENKRTSIFDEDFVGLMFDFLNVDGLTMTDLRLVDATCYHVRLGEVTNFRLENIKFDGLNRPGCQDGIHMGGFCAHGLIRNIYARPGSMGDDLIALNADDVFTYPHNWDMKAGLMTDITVENVEAPDCYTGVRLLSIFSEISHIRFRNLKIGVREHGLNLDAARYCNDPLFTSDEYPNGVGNLKDIVFENLTLWKSAPNSKRELLTYETNSPDVQIYNFNRPRENEVGESPALTIRMRNMATTDYTLDGVSHTLPRAETWDWNENAFSALLIQSKA